MECFPGLCRPACDCSVGCPEASAAEGYVVGPRFRRWPDHSLHASAGSKRAMPRLATGVGRSRSLSKGHPASPAKFPILAGSPAPPWSQQRADTGIHPRILSPRAEACSPPGIVEAIPGYGSRSFDRPILRSCGKISGAGALTAARSLPPRRSTPGWSSA